MFITSSGTYPHNFTNRFVFKAYPVEHQDNDNVVRTVIGTAKSKRTKRQNSWMMVSGPCLTGRGTLGKCTSFRLCYPYIKIPDFQYWDSWVVGMYDTCTYINGDHKQVNKNNIILIRYLYRFYMVYIMMNNYDSFINYNCLKHLKNKTKIIDTY